MQINLKRGHTCIVGMTGTGKTYAARRALQAWSGGVLFVNTMHGESPRGFTKADGRTSLQGLLYALQDGDKINFTPSRDSDQRERQLVAIINALEQERQNELVLAVDEIHLYRGQAERKLISVATTGRQWGITLVSITQRLARLHNDLMTQSPQKVIFSLENEEQYCARYGIPYTEIEKRNWQLDPPKTGATGANPEPSHAYCIYYMGQIEGAYKV